MSDPNEPDYYRVLNVHHQADREIIAEAYQRMRAKHRGTPAAEREIEAAWAVLGDPDRRAAYDARRAARKRPGTPSREVAPAPKKEVMPRPAAQPGEETQTVPARCSLTGDTFQIVLVRAKGPFERWRVIGFEPGGAPPAHPASGSGEKKGFFSRLFGPSTQPHPLDRPAESSADDAGYLDFSRFDFAGHACPVCAGDAPTASRWAMCGRCNQVLCLGALDTHGAQSITCPWCGVTMRFGGPTRSGGGRVRASARPSSPPPDPPKLPPTPPKSLPGR